jgi:hypothetical protein
MDSLTEGLRAMNEPGFLPVADAYAWMACAGKPSLEEHESPDLSPIHIRELPAEFREVAAQARAAGATVTVIDRDRLDVSVVTGEPGAHAFADGVIITEHGKSTTLALWLLKAPPLPDDWSEIKILALAACVKYQLVHDFSLVDMTYYVAPKAHSPKLAMTAEALMVFGQTVTEMAHLALSLRADATALAHLVPGALQCKHCRAAYRCPALKAALDL